MIISSIISTPAIIGNNNSDGKRSSHRKNNNNTIPSSPEQTKEEIKTITITNTKINTEKHREDEVKNKKKNKQNRSTSSKNTSTSSSSSSSSEGEDDKMKTKEEKNSKTNLEDDNKKKKKKKKSHEHEEDHSQTSSNSSSSDAHKKKKKKEKKKKNKESKNDRKNDITSESTTKEEEKMQKKIRKAKRGTRSEISVTKGGWTKHGYAYDDANVLNTKNLKSKAGVIERISAKEVSQEDFDRRFAFSRTPCIITDAMDHWPCFMKKALNNNNYDNDNDNPREWTIEKLQKRFPNERFKVGSDDDGYAVRLTMSEFQFYCDEEKNPDNGCKRDDSPLYVFDGSIFDKENTKELAKDFEIPEYFSEDLFKYVGHKRRPPHRWVVFGPPRSGSSVHVDPLATSAWNALISGQKRWVLYPPDKGLTKSLLKPRGIGLDGESVTWFQKAYPLTQTREWSEVGGCPKSFDVVQNAGEIMFVPDGWWHAVLNVTHTVAVTQNFCTTPRFDAVYRATRRGRPKMSKKWLEKLKAKGRQDLYQTAMRQPRRSQYSENEKTSSSSSSSSEGESDTEKEEENCVVAVHNKVVCGEDANDRIVRLRETAHFESKHGKKART